MSRRHRRLAWLALAAACLACPAPPAVAGKVAPDTVLVIPGSHLDVGFTDVPSKVREKRIATLDRAIDAAQKDPDFRWTEEGGWVVHEWLAAHAKDEARIAALRALVVGGRIGVGACYVNPHAALFPSALHHLFAFDDVVESVLGARPRVAVINDVPSLPEAFVDAAVAAGVQGLLMGPNLAFSAPLPWPRRPFVWNTARGAHVIVSADPDSYTAAFTKWGIDPATAKFFDPKRFAGLEGLEFARVALSLAEANPEELGAVALQQAFDNWGPEAAMRLPGFCRDLRANETAKVLPEIRPAVPADALAAWKEKDLSEVRGEWGGEWEEVRAGCPFTTARLRHVATATPRDAPMEKRLAIALAMDHTGGLGPGWPGYFTEEQTKAHAAEWAAMFGAAIGDAPDAALAAVAKRNAGRRVLMSPDLSSLSFWLDVESCSPALRRARQSLGGPYFPPEPPISVAKTGAEASAGALTLWARLDRSSIPGDEEGNVDVGWDVPLTAAFADVRAWPVGSESGAEGKWLRGTPPLTYIAPDGLAVETPARRLVFASELAFGYRLANVDGKAHVQALLVRQCRRCDLKGGATKVLPFADLYPGEPALLDAELTVTPAPR